MTQISLREYHDRLRDLIEQGRYDKALAHGKHILKQYPKERTTYWLLGKTTLEAGQDDYAADMFRRVLSADPESLLAWIGLSEIYQKRGELEAAVWYLERAFELATNNEAIAEELRHLYGRLHGSEPERVSLTRDALAKLYLEGNLLSKAINELQDLLEEHPKRADLGVALAEALWRDGQRLEASSACQRMLDKLPYCLKANLILGQIWTNSGRPEGNKHLERAQAVDPENQMAQELFGDDSPLPAREVQIALLEYEPEAEEEPPAWMAEMEEAPAEEEAKLADTTEGLEAQIEIPQWLQDIAMGEEEPPTPKPSEEQPPTEAVASPTEEPPEERAFAVEEEPEERIEEQPEAEEVPEWLEELGTEAPAEAAAEKDKPEAEPTPAEAPTAPEAGEEGEEGEEGEIPAWLAEVGAEQAEEKAEVQEEAPAPAEEAKPPEEAPEEAEVPEWLKELAPEEVEEEAPAAAPTAEEKPAPPEEEPPVEKPPVEEKAPLEEEEAPAWMEGEEMPTGDEALAWLEQLAEGKEEELQAQAAAEAETRMAEIMGRQPEEAPPEEKAPAEEAAPPMEEAPPAEEAPPKEEAEVPEWLRELAPEEVEEAGAPETVPTAEEKPAPPEEEPPVEKPPVEEKAPLEEEEAPGWMEGKEMPTGDEALAWLEQLAEGKEEELQAQAAAEAETRMAEIMGRQPEEAPPEKEAAEEAAPAEEVEPPPTEEAPPKEEAEVPEWLEELAPEEAEEEEAPEAFPAAEEEPAPPEEKAPVEEVAPPAEAVEAPVEEAPPTKEAPEWLEELAPEEVEEGAPEAFPAAEEEVPPAEAAPEAPPAPPEEEEVAPSIAEEKPTLPEIPPSIKETMQAWLEGEEVLASDEVLTWLKQLAEAGIEAKAMVPKKPEKAPPEAEETVSVEEKAPPEAPPEAEEPTPPTERGFGWTAFGAPEAPIEAYPEVEEAPPPKEITPEEVTEEMPVEEPAPPSKVAFGWTAFGEPGTPLEVLPAEGLPPTEEKPPEVLVEAVPAEAEEKELIEEPPVPEPDLTEAIAAKKAHLEDNERDYEVWLDLARMLWKIGEREEAVEAYNEVIGGGKLLGSVIPDLEEKLEQWPDPSVQQALGDAYMKDGRLQEALDTYRGALETL